MVLTKSTVTRGVVLLEEDAYRELVMRRLEEACIAIARCRKCGSRARVLPADVLARKTYGAAVIAHTSAQYARGGESLREVVLGVHGNDTLAHTTLHGWTEGLGAHVLGRPGGDAGGVPVSRFLAEAAARVEGVAAAMQQEVHIDPRRYRSEARRERLVAVVLILAVMTLVATLPHPWAMAECRRQSLLWSQSSALVCRSRLACTAFEQVGDSSSARSRPVPGKSRDRCPTRTRSPPGASNSSLP
jgi:hypothetical protein